MNIEPLTKFEYDLSAIPDYALREMEKTCCEHLAEDATCLGAIVSSAVALELKGRTLGAVGKITIPLGVLPAADGVLGAWQANKFAELIRKSAKEHEATCPEYAAAARMLGDFADALYAAMVKQLRALYPLNEQVKQVN